MCAGRKALGVIIAFATVGLLVLLGIGCSGSGGGSDSAVNSASKLASAIDDRSNPWVNLKFGVEEQTTVRPAVTLAYAANAGDGGVSDGALEVVYTGESGSDMRLQIFDRISPQALPTGSQTLSIKVKAVAGCVKKAVLFIADRGTGWYNSIPPVDLTADAWTTISLTVDPGTFTAGIWRIGVQFNGDNSDPQAAFADHGTIYVDDFSALDYRANDFSSANQLINSCYFGSDDGSGFSQVWEAGTVSGDGYLTNHVTFPSTMSANWGTWMGTSIDTGVYGTDTLVDLSNSTMVIRIYLPQAWIDEFNLSHAGSWLSIYDGAGNHVEIWWSMLSPPVLGWNTISVNFTDPRLKDGSYCSNTAYDYTKVQGTNIGVGGTPAMAGLSFIVKVDYFDVSPN